MRTTEAYRLRWPLHLGMKTKRGRIIIHFRLHGKQVPTGADGMGPFVFNSSHGFKDFVIVFVTLPTRCFMVIPTSTLR